MYAGDENQTTQKNEHVEYFTSESIPIYGVNVWQLEVESSSGGGGQGSQPCINNPYQFYIQHVPRLPLEPSWNSEKQPARLGRLLSFLLGWIDVPDKPLECLPLSICCRFGIAVPSMLQSVMY